jgi:hypothetical protein
MKKTVPLDPTLEYFCSIGKKPNLGKIRNCCVGRGCPLIATTPRKESEPQLVKIADVRSSNNPSW